MVFSPIVTDRLVLRAALPDDVDAAFERRRLPEVSRYQDWETPYLREWAEASVSKLLEMDGPADGKGWQATVVDRSAPDRIVGDVYVGIKWGGRSAEIGYTFHPDHWGHGYATEATTAMIEWLFLEFGVQRVEATLHPDNSASARVLERCGLLYEGLTRDSFWVGDEISDDLLYGMPRADWDAWLARPRHKPDVVELVALTAANRYDVSRLVTHKSQEAFVSPMLGNFRDALVPPLVDGAPLDPWYRAIVADGDIVGFIMAAHPTATRANPYLWRLLVDRMHQRRGIGAAALDQFEHWCRAQGATAVEVSWVPEPGGPAPFYLDRSYVPTGRVDDGEIHARKALA